MVYFTCGACGESLKKGAVEKHYSMKCRSCNVLTCIDCLKDFHGEEYKNHNQCMSEDQRYSKEGRSGWDPSQGQGNKGQRKQETWIVNLKTLVEGAQLDSDVKNIVNTIFNHENIPRKKPKFVNFVKNIMRNKASVSSIDKTWDLFSQAQKPAKAEENGVKCEVKADNSDSIEGKGEKKKKKNKQSSEVTNGDVDMSSEVKADNSDADKSKVKKKKKKNKQCSEVVNAVVEISTEGNAQEDPKKSKKKKRNKEDKDKENVEQNDNIQDSLVKTMKKKKKKEKIENEEISEHENTVKESKKRKRNDETIVEKDCDEPEAKKLKFNWDTVMTTLLEKQDNKEMKLKKLQKKCVAEFLAQNAGTHKTKEELNVKFNKILKKRKYVVKNDRVKLKIEDIEETRIEDMEVDANDVVLPPVQKQENGSLSFNKWEATNFGSSAQNDKFRRLMGIKSAPPPQDIKVGNKRDDKKVFKDLEDSFEKAREIRQSGKGMGLGFTA